MKNLHRFTNEDVGKFLNAFPTPVSGRRDGQLSNISLAYTNADYIHDKILPVVPNLKDESGYIGSYGNEHLRVYSSAKRGVWDENEHRIEFTISNDNRYVIDYYDLEIYVPDRLKNQLQLPFDAYRDSLMVLEEARNVAMENALATALTSTSILTNYTSITTKWTDYVNSDPYADIQTAITGVVTKTGRMPNKAWLSYSVLATLQNHPAMLDKVRAIQKTLSLTEVIDILKAHFGFTDIFVGKARKITSKSGQTETSGFIWGNDFGIYYAPSGPSLMTPTFGYRFELAGMNKQVTQRRHTSDTGDMIRLSWAFQDKILDVNSAYLLKGCI